MPIDNVKIQISKNHNHDVIHYFIDYDQPVSKSSGHTNGKSSLTQCMVFFEISLDVLIKELLTWQTDQSQKKTISIDLYDNGQKKRSYELENTYLYSLEQTITKNTDNSLVQQIKLHLSPLSIKMDGHLWKQAT